MKSRIVMAALSLSAAALCVLAFRSVWIRITNDTLLDVDEVRVQGRGFSTLVGSIRPGRSRCVRVELTRESGLAITYRQNHAPFAQGDLAYLESWSGSGAALSLRAAANVRKRHAFGPLLALSCVMSIDYWAP